MSASWLFDKIEFKKTSALQARFFLVNYFLVDTKDHSTKFNIDLNLVNYTIRSGLSILLILYAIKYVLFCYCEFALQL